MCPDGGQLLTCSRVCRNAAESPLLRLPAEIRNQIWREVLGDRSIHLQHTSPAKPGTTVSRWTGLRKQTALGWRHLICTAPRNEVKEYQHWKVWNAEEPRLGLPYIYACYKHCMQFTNDLNKTDRLVELAKKDRSGRKLQLELLRSCRQVYVEANSILWETDTFAFNESHTFDMFFKNRPSFQSN